MIARWLEERLVYDGSALRAHWILATTGIGGDAMVAFRGPCRVTLAEMADLEDVAGPGIAGDDMVHCVWERFDDAGLETGILRLRLLAARAAELLVERGVTVRRDGDDLWIGEGKLSIGIATRSPVSTLIHFAVNVSTAGVPVRAAGLADLGVPAREFAEALLERTVAEELDIRAARVKVRTKGEAS